MTGAGPERKQEGGETANADAPRLLYCRCAYAQVVPREVKDEVLLRLSESGAPFEAVADLCEMSARQDPELGVLAGGGSLRVAACYPRAVKWMFAAGGAPLPEAGIEVLNMRVESADTVMSGLLGSTGSVRAEEQK